MGRSGLTWAISRCQMIDDCNICFEAPAKIVSSHDDQEVETSNE